MKQLKISWRENLVEKDDKLLYALRRCGEFKELEVSKSWDCAERLKLWFRSPVSEQELLV